MSNSLHVPWNKAQSNNLAIARNQFPTGHSSEFSVYIRQWPQPRSFSKVTGAKNKELWAPFILDKYTSPLLPLFPHASGGKQRLKYHDINSLQVHNTANHMGSSLSFTISVPIVDCHQQNSCLPTNTTFALSYIYGAQLIIKTTTSRDHQNRSHGGRLKTMHPLSQHLYANFNHP